MTYSTQFGTGCLSFPLNTHDDIKLAIHVYDVLGNRYNALLIREAIELLEDPDIKFMVARNSKILKELPPSFRKKYIIEKQDDPFIELIHNDRYISPIIKRHSGSMSFHTYELFLQDIVRHTGMNIRKHQSMKNVGLIGNYRILELEYYIALLEKELPGNLQVGMLLSAIKLVSKQSHLIRQYLEENSLDEQLQGLITNFMHMDGCMISKQKIAMELIAIVHLYRHYYPEGPQLEEMIQYIESSKTEQIGELEVFGYNTLSEFNTNSPIIDYLNQQQLVLKEQRKQLEAELYIIPRSKHISTIQDIEPVQSCQELPILYEIQNSIRKENIKCYRKDMRACSKIPAFIMSRKAQYDVMTCDDANGEALYFAKDKELLNVYLICTVTVPNTIVLVPIIKRGQVCDKTIKNLRCKALDEFDRTDRISVIEFKDRESNDYKPKDLTVLTEGIDIDREGNVRLALPRNSSYMDQYASLHRMITQINVKEDREDLKMLLAEMFQLIDITEQEMRKYKERKKRERKYRDAEKARMFLINDFKRYLGELQQLEPEFNFPKYYKDNEYDILTYEVKSDSIIGIKRLIKKIMMSS